MIAVIDYGAGNLASVAKSLRYIGADVVVTSDPGEVAKADKLVLPGVGAFSHCMSGLNDVHLSTATTDFIQTGRPFLGICVGLQMLFDVGEELGETAGLGVLAGRVVKFDFEQGAEYDDHPKIPHIGWNNLDIKSGSVLLDGLGSDDRFYFVHSFYAVPADPAIVAATCTHGYRFCAAVERGNLFATQFHPEKSGDAGLHILRNFNRLDT